MTILNNINHKNHKPKYVKINKQDNESTQNFHNETLHSLEQENINNTINKDPNINYNILHNIIQHAKTKHMPHKFVRFKKYKHRMSPWITHGIVKSIQYRDNLYKKHKMTQPETPEFDAQKVNLKAYNTILKRSIHLAKKSYYETLFLKFMGDIKGTWKTIKLN